MGFLGLRNKTLELVLFGFVLFYFILLFLFSDSFSGFFLAVNDTNLATVFRACAQDATLIQPIAAHGP